MINCRACLFKVSVFMLLVGAATATAQQTSNNPPFIDAKAQFWADSIMQKLTVDERIAQLFMVAAFSNKDKKHYNEIKKLISNYHIGGLIFFQGGPVRQAHLTNQYQRYSKVPLMISIDGEWGLSMRLDSTLSFPRQMTLGAIQNDSLIYAMGREIAFECHRLGIHVNFAPVVDINSNPLNPVISNRSFGENKYLVTRKSLMYMKGLQNNGVLANAKHFPGHGDTDGDSHKTLPSILHTRRQLDTLDLVPFKELINQGLGSMMVAHLYVPALDSTRNTPSTLSKKIVTGLLRDDLHFKGLVFTDALNMKGISTVNKPGIVDVRAILAGNDVLLYADSIPAAIKEIKLAIAQGEITQEDIDNRCRKILQAKFWAGLNHYKPIEIKNLTSDLNPLSAQLLNRQLAEASITVLKNNQNLLPLQRLDTLHIAYVTIGDQESNSFQEQLQNYCTLSAFSVLKTTKPKQIDTLLEKLKSYNLVIVQISKTTNHPDKNFGLIPQAADLIAKICKENTTIVNLAGNPYILSRLEHITDAEAIVLSYEDTKLSGEAAASLLVGAIGANGKLPVNASADFKIGTGLEVKSLGRIKYTIPEEENIQSSDLAAIDSIALSGIRSKIYPGCQIYIAKNQKVIYNKSFGYFKYDKQHKVRNADLYDLASITKIAASTLAMMKLVQEGKVKLDDSLAVYLPELTGTNKQGLILRNVLTHQAGLKPWIAFEQDTHLKDKVTHKIKYIPGVFAKEASDEYPSRVAEHLYVHQGYDTVIYNKINKSELKGAGKFIYSDLGYYYLKKIIEKQTGMSLADYVDKNFYKPMGLSTMGYLPRNHFSVDQIAPTELDLTFRNQQLQGDVHDQGAALLGGIAGHAGLFSNASDLGVLMQMYLQKGEYAGKRYLDTAVVSEFTRCQFCKSNHRALGFDKPDLDNPKQNPVCDCVSYLSFGHSGFTGTLTWVDPAKQLVYVFLSNRVYPKAEPNKLAKSGIRTKIQQVIYNAIH